jgi:hypothetical protein
VFGLGPTEDTGKANLVTFINKRPFNLKKTPQIIDCQETQLFTHLAAFRKMLQAMFV